MYGANNMKKSVVFNNQFTPKLGGQFELESGGHFELESGAHFKLELGGQYHWNLQSFGKWLFFKRTCKYSQNKVSVYK